MKKTVLDKWSDYPLDIRLDLRNFFIVNSRFFHPKPLFICSLWFFAIGSLISIKLLKIFIPLFLIYFYQKLTIKRVVKNFRIKKIVPQVTKENQRENLVYKIENPNPYSYYNFSLFEKNEASSTQRTLSTYLPQLRPQQSIKLNFQVLMDNGMGYKAMGPLMAVFSDELGINRVTYLDDFQKKIKVFPFVYPTRNIKLKADLKSMTFGNFDSYQKGNNVNFYSTREYVQGDSINHINWKLSLKSQKMIVNQFESNINAQFYAVLLDDERLHYGEGRFSSLEYCKDLMLSLLYSQVRTNNQMGFYTSQKFIQAKSGQSHLNALELYIATLATIQLEEMRSYSKKNIQRKKIDEFFQKLRFHVPQQSNLFVFAGFIPGAIMDIYINHLVQLAPRYNQIHLVLTHGLSHLRKTLSKEERVWLAKIEADIRTSTALLKETCKGKNIKLSLVNMGTEFKYDHVIKEGFRNERI